MLNFQAQSPFADVLASLLRAQLRATSDALSASVRAWSMWTQMLTTRPAMGEQPTAARLHHPRIVWSMPWSIFGPMLWSIAWPTNRLLPGLWQGSTGELAQLEFIPFAPIWWTAPGRGCWPPSTNALASAVHASAGPEGGFSAGRDASFANYRSAGGHALAQVIVKPTEELAQATARAWLSPLEAMLGLWRAALGV